MLHSDKKKKEENYVMVESHKIIMSGRSQGQKKTYYLVPFIRNVKKSKIFKGNRNPIKGNSGKGILTGQRYRKYSELLKILYFFLGCIFIG